MGYQSTLTSWADDTWPDYAPDEVLPGLFQGGTEDHEVIGYPAADHHYARIGGRGRLSGAAFPFDVVVTLYADAQPAPWGVREHRYGFADGSLSAGDAAVVVDLARTAHAAWRSGSRVLVRCQAGVNRSGLVTALVLMLEGYSAESAIALLRARRGSVVLCNEEFEEWLLTRAATAITSSRGHAA
jgi:Dual specificity phosphatase, catalytic domain